MQRVQREAAAVRHPRVIRRCWRPAKNNIKRSYRPARRVIGQRMPLAVRDAPRRLLQVRHRDHHKAAWRQHPPELGQRNRHIPRRQMLKIVRGIDRLNRRIRHRQVSDARHDIRRNARVDIKPRLSPLSGGEDHFRDAGTAAADMQNLHTATPSRAATSCRSIHSSCWLPRQPCRPQCQSVILGSTHIAPPSRFQRSEKA